MILRINPVRYWNFVSQTDVNEQVEVVFTSEFLNSFLPVTHSISRVTKKMRFFKSLLRMILRINPVPKKMKFFKSLITHDPTY